MDVTMLEAGRELDALVAEKVMGLTILARDWPCGPDPECSTYVAAGTLQVGLLEEAAFYPDRGPVTADPGGLVSTLYGPTKCPVPFYSTDIAAAWQVVEHLRTIGYEIILANAYPTGWVATVFKVGTFTDEDVAAATMPLALCRATLAALATLTE